MAANENAFYLRLRAGPARTMMCRRRDPPGGATMTNLTGALQSAADDAGLDHLSIHRRRGPLGIRGSRSDLVKRIGG
jgi:hypothetical protein